jgi:hypothetical protein
MYLSKEMNWLHGQNFPANSFSKHSCRNRATDNVDRWISYLSTIGNQCGCGTVSFQPSHSYWLYGTHLNTKYSNRHSLQLARQFAKDNRTVCFVGDSVDYQFYWAMRNNLLRAELLHQEHFNSSILNISSRVYPAVHVSADNISEILLNEVREHEMSLHSDIF